MNPFKEFLANAEATASLRPRYYALTTLIGLAAVVVGAAAWYVCLVSITTRLAVPLNQAVPLDARSIWIGAWFLLGFPICIYVAAVMVAGVYGAMMILRGKHVEARRDLLRLAFTLPQSMVQVVGSMSASGRKRSFSDPCFRPCFQTQSVQPVVHSFRFAILFALVSAAGALYLPTAPLSITLPQVNLGEAVPAEQMASLAGALSLMLISVALPLMGIAAFGLFRFRSWARPLAAWATSMAALSVAGMLALLPVGSTFSKTAVVLFIASGSAWALALMLLRSDQVRARFPRTPPQSVAN